MNVSVRIPEQLLSRIDGEITFNPPAGLTAANRSEFIRHAVSEYIAWRDIREDSLYGDPRVIQRIEAAIASLRQTAQSLERRQRAIAGVRPHQQDLIDPPQR